MSKQKNPRSFRLVCEPDKIPLVEAALEAEGYRFAPEPFSPWCRRLLAEPRPLGSSLAAFFGYIYIQDRSSMLPPLALAPASGSAVLDMCASPGSKTGFLAQLTGPAGFVLANEPNAARLASLRANARAMNLFQIGLCSFPGERLPLFPGSWDAVLLDPPCSGWGTEEKHPRVREIWRGEKINRLVALQRALLKKAVELLAPGGRLLYSTCTTNPRENEEQTRYMEEELGLVRESIPPFPGFAYEDGEDGALLISARESSAQGFYLSLARAPDGRAPAREETFFAAETFAPEEIASPLVDPALLAEGRAAEFGRSIRYLPSASFSQLPARFAWRAFDLGVVRVAGVLSSFAPDDRLRRLARVDGPRVDLESAEEARALLAGRIVGRGDGSGAVSLWLRDLPLGFARLKNGRLVASFR